MDFYCCSYFSDLKICKFILQIIDLIFFELCNAFGRFMLNIVWLLVFSK